MTRRRVLAFVAVALLAVGIGLVIDATNGLRRLELSTVDTRFSLRGAQDPPSDVVIVGIDDKTLDAGKGSTLPLDRTRHAQVIDRLTKAGASVIAYDIQFTEPSGDTDEATEADNALIEAVRASPKVVLGTTLPGPDGRVFGGGEGYEYSRATAGSTLYDADIDGRTRQMPFRMERLETLSVAAARLHGGERAPREGSAWIDFPGPPGTVRSLSFVDVENGNFDPALVRGRVVVVGATASRARDLHATPTSREGRMSGPEINAAAIATAVADFPLDDGAGWLGILAIIVLGLAAPLAALRFGAGFALLVAFGASLAYLVIVQVAFGAGTILPVVAPLAAAAIGGFGALLVAPPTRAPWMDRLLDRITGAGGNQRTRRLRASWLIAAAFSVSAVVLVAEATHGLRSLDNSSVDWRFRVRGPVPPPKDVVVIAIDDKTLNTEGVTYPFSRALHAQVIRNLTKAGAGVIAYDVEFSEPSEDEKADAELIEAIRAAGNVVLSTTDTESATDAQLLNFGKGLAYSRGIPGWTQVIEDPDAKLRRMPFTFDGKPLFAIVAAEQLLGRPLALPGGESAWMNFAGDRDTIDYISFIDIHDGTFPASAVRGKAVVVGGTQTSLQDLHHTSTTSGAQMPGPEIQATSISTALAGFPLRSAPWWLNVLLVIAVTVAAPVVALRRGVLLAIAAGVVMVGVALVAAQLAFERSDLLVKIVYPVVGGIAAILLTAAIHGVTVAFEREQARDAFARFVPEAVVDQVLADADGARLGGVRGVATVMFSDLRGFTSFSETLEPERVIDSLNRYLTLMSEAILDHGGTLVAYMGDGIMAVFGAPLKQDDHADRALDAAREMLSRMDEFNGYLREQGLSETGFKMGIGLNSGPVMSGNVGSERRLEYTALGDTTNTAARLEGMTKGTPHQLYISDTTKQMFTRPVGDLVAVGEAEVRGRKAKVLLWSISDEEPAAPVKPAPERVEA